MAVSAAVTKSFDQGQCLQIHGTLTFTSNYGAGGEDLTSVFVGSSFLTRGPAYALLVNDTSGWVFRYDATNNKLIVFGQEPTNAGAGQLPLTELSAGAYPATLTTDQVLFVGWFPKG